MNGQDNDNQEILDLPKPQQNQIPVNIESGEAGSPNEAARSAAIERTPVSAGPAPQASGLPVALPLPPNKVDPTSQQGTGQNVPLAQDLPAIADDADLIEKEWVNKAKEIVEKTKADPYQQNKEVSRVKADYLKKRYNKELKLAEDS